MFVCVFGYFLTFVLFLNFEMYQYIKWNLHLHPLGWPLMIVIFYNFYSSEGKNTAESKAKLVTAYSWIKG